MSTSSQAIENRGADTQDDTPSAKRSQTSLRYPTISDWLQYCDNDEVRKRGNRNFSQFAMFFEEHDYKFLDELIGFTEDKMKEICIGMRSGTVSCLVNFVKEDDKAIQRGKYVIS